MSESLFFVTQDNPSSAPAVLAEAVHIPDALASASGLYISAAVMAMLQHGSHILRGSDGWHWIAVESGSLCMSSDDGMITVVKNECFMLPPMQKNVTLEVAQEARILGFTVGGTLSQAYMALLGALPRRVLKQGALPGQIKLCQHIVQAAVRLSTTEDASSAQLQQLLWGMLASHNGQPVAMDAVMSHEIAKVVDAMRQNQYKDNFSLNDMANISRMPVETFRKRFVSEVGMPPQSYQLFCKMERAKSLLKAGFNVRTAGAEVGIADPYHFSKTFKNIVGMSPSTYAKTALK